jgi:hypothetical protein
MSSQRKLDANRRNAKSSTGPKTQAGKKQVRLNALKHGFFAKDLIIEQKYKSEVDELHLDIFSQMMPKTALQRIAFKEVTFCAWRCEIAARLEVQYWSAQLEPADAQEPTPDTNEKPTIVGWFALGPVELKNGIRFLEFLKAEVNRCGELRAEWRDEIIKGFGPGLWDLLEQPKSHISYDAILQADHLTRHAATFKKPLPPIERDGPAPIIDPEQRLRTILALLGQQQQFLETIRMIGRVCREQTSRGADDSFFGHFTRAARALHEAVAWYKYLAEKNL